MSANWGTDGAGDEFARDVRQMVRRYVEQHPPDGHHSAPVHGRIHPVDPAVAARFKAILVQQEGDARRQLQRAINRGAQRRSRVDPDLRKKADEIAARARAKRLEQAAPVEPVEPEKEQEMPAPRKLDDNEVVAAHRRYVLENLAVSVVAAAFGVADTPLRKHFERLGLPTRGRDGRFRPGAVEVICRAHGLQPDDIPQDARPFGPVAKVEKPKAAKPQPVQTAVVVEMPEPVAETAVTPTNGAQPAAHPANDLAAIAGQLEALQSLMAEAKAKSIEISGWIRMEISAEVTF